MIPLLSPIDIAVPPCLCDVAYIDQLSRFIFACAVATSSPSLQDCCFAAPPSLWDVRTELNSPFLPSQRMISPRARKRQGSRRLWLVVSSFRTSLCVLPPHACTNCTLTLTLTASLVLVPPQRKARSSACAISASLRTARCSIRTLAALR